MIGQELPKYLENLFGVARLHGWCDDVHKMLAELRSQKDEALVAELRTLLDGLVRKAGVEKEEAILSLILLHDLGVPERDLYAEAYRGLNGRLYINDFRFLVRYFFGNKIPLPRSLAYDITERLLFSLEDIYDKIVKDFTLIPFRNAEPVVLYLILQNCRVDLNSQNKELICIILTHIEIKLPDSILSDIIKYLDENATLRENWLAQRKTIEFSRELPEERSERIPKKKSDRDRLATLGEVSPGYVEPLEPSYNVDVGPVSVRLTDRSSPKAEEPEPKERMEAKAEARPEAPDIRPRRAGEEIMPPLGKGAEYDIPLATRDSAGRKEERPDILAAGNLRKERDPGSEPMLSTNDYTAIQRGGAASKAEKPDEPIIGERSRVPAGEGTVRGEPEKEKDEKIEYDDFMEAGRERGIFLSRLNRNLWAKRVKAKDGSKSESLLTGVGNIASGLLKKMKTLWTDRKKFVILSAVIALLVLTAIVAISSGSRTSSAPHETGASPIFLSAVPTPATGPPVSQAVSSPAPTVFQKTFPPAEEKSFVLQDADGRIEWQVRKDESFFGLFLHLKLTRASLDPRLRELANSSWQTFQRRVIELNTSRFPSRGGFDLIFPSERFILTVR